MQENYRTFLLKTECLSILFECLTLDKGTLRRAVWELIVPRWLCDTQLAKEKTCPKIFALIKATATGHPGSRRFSETHVLNLMSDIVAQRSWLRKRSGAHFQHSARTHLRSSHHCPSHRAGLRAELPSLPRRSARERIFASWSPTLFGGTHPHTG